MKFLTFICLFFSQLLFAQNDSLKNFKIALGVEAGIYAGSIYSLNQLWYKDFPRSSFHWHNDNSNWLQMDKLGHSFSSYQLGLLSMDIFRSYGISEKKSIWYGGTYGTVFLTTIEILDGFSKEWGASWGDLLANTFGTSLLVFQEIIWKEQRLQLKYSFLKSKYSDKNPELLGSSLSQQLIKDYNGQTIWLSANINSFIKESKLPYWLNVAFGYGVDGMIYSNSNINEKRQFYISLDVDLRRVDTGNKFLNKTLKFLSFIKIPSPTILIDDLLKFKFSPFYYGQ
tara:strand:- start:4272 stop:5123 length:852 start_codon:yes stop_codon:yes gene_type:complete